MATTPPAKTPAAPPPPALPDMCGPEPLGARKLVREGVSEGLKKAGKADGKPEISEAEREKFIDGYKKTPRFAFEEKRVGGPEALKAVMTDGLCSGIAKLFAPDAYATIDGIVPGWRAAFGIVAETALAPEPIPPGAPAKPAGPTGPAFTRGGEVPASPPPPPPPPRPASIPIADASGRRGVDSAPARIPIGPLGTSGPAAGGNLATGPKTEAKITIATASEIPVNSGGSLDDAKIEQVVQAHKVDTVLVYERHLKRNESLKGKFEITVTVDKGGKVTDAQPPQKQRPGTEDLYIDLCVLVRNWSFPSSDEGGTAVISFIFQSAL